ncbi:DUF1801 domain-containing protein [Ferrovibrio sp.]|uniref:DUF1801 domain-containing protein n=1 Tax=Ferrovibrio sp. TaxID=1917215 RepID=UPI003513A122
MVLSAPPKQITAALACHPAPVRRRLLQIRALIYAVAAETEGVGVLTETLKWGEPAYLTASGSGTTIRLGATRAAPDRCAVFVNCQTSLIDGFRAQFGDLFGYEGNRALLIPATGRLPAVPLSLCLRAALTYHQQKKTAATRQG